MPSAGFASVTLADERYNGLKLKAMKDNRSVSNMLDVILDNAGVEMLTEKEYEKKAKEVAA